MSKSESPSGSTKTIVAAVIGVLLIGASIFFVAAINNKAGGSPGFFGTRASLFADINLVAEIILLLGLVVGYGFARQGNIPAHQYNQTGWVLFNIILVIFIMGGAFGRQVIPGIPARLMQAFTLVSAIHGVLGLITILCGIYILLRMNKLLPAALRISWWKNLMRITLGLYWLVGLFGFGTYYVWYVAPREEVAVSTPEPGVVAEGGKVTLPLANYEFVPKELTIPVGTTVVFQNFDPDAHTATFDNDEFPAFGFQQGSTNEITFDKVGDYQYYCEYHGSPGVSGMAGVIHVVEAGAVAALPTSVTIPTETPQPTPVPFEVQILSVNGAGIFRDASARNDSFQLSLSGMPTGINGTFFAWLTGGANTSPLPLGAFPADAGNNAQFIYLDGHGDNLVAKYSGFIVTVEAAGSTPANPSDQIVFGGRIADDVLGPARALLAVSGDAPNNTGYALGLLDQAEELTHHTSELNNAAQNGDRNSMNRHIEHMYAIISGKGSPDYIDFDGDQFVDDPGDGFGLLTYADRIEAQANAVLASANTSDNAKAQAQKLITVAGNIRTWSKRLLELGLGAHEAKTDDDRKAHTTEIPGVAGQLLTGIDANGNGTVEATTEEGGAFTLYFNAQDMAGVGALAEADLAALPTPAPPTATPEPGITPSPTATAGPTATPGPVTVTLRNFEFVPTELTVPAGAKIVFSILDSQHGPYLSFPNSIDIAGFDAGTLNPGQTTSITFSNPGTFTIRCGVHPNKMVMTLTVTAP
ncbi:MAG: cupredoxin domain-containing protein [Chloroflexi bacterium]|nr:cupredoxin domain-containing protein [Chloroflexota bacterium]